MKLLLDTHAFIWWDGDQSRLSPTALAACESADNSLHLSLPSIWELQIKIQLGKLSVRLPIGDIIRDQRANGLLLEPIALDDILGLASLPSHHRDPFDRLLVSQAIRGDFQLISQDPEISRYSVPVLW